MIKKKFLPTLSIFLILPLILAACLPSLGPSDKSEGLPDYVQGRVVANFPPIPFYEEATVIESYGYKGTFGASFISSDSVKDVSEFYNRSLAEAGWEVNSEAVERGYLFKVKNEKYQGEVIVNSASDDKKTAITMAISEK